MNVHNDFISSFITTTDFNNRMIRHVLQIYT